MERDAAIFQSLALSLASFTSDFPYLKVLRPENRISCDPVEVLESFGMEGLVSVDLLREAMETCAAYGRKAQARLALLTAALLAETPPLPLGALRRAGRRATEAAQRRRAEPPAERAAPVTLMPDCQEDDVSWFFTEEVEAVAAVPSEPQAQAPPDLKSVQDISAEICRRMGGGCGSISGSGTGEQFFVYGCLRPQQPEISLQPGIICHVPCDYVAARGSMLAALTRPLPEERPKILRSAFLDADLTSAAYESVAPRERRLKQQFHQTLAPDGRFLSATAARDQLLVEPLQALARAGLEALLISGDVSEAVKAGCCHCNLLLVAGIPARLLHALAEDCGAEVLHGLPDITAVTAGVMPWESREVLNLQLAPASDKCFCFPLLGLRQPLLPEGSEAWQLSASADSSAAASATARISGASEAQTQLLAAELCEAVQRSRRSETLEEDWLQHTAAALESASVAFASADADADAEAEADAAPWLREPEEEALQDAAAYSALGRALLRMQAMEQQVPGPEEEVAKPDQAEAVLAVLRRAVRLAELLSHMSPAP